MLNIDALELPHTGREPWKEAYDELRAALAERGWRLCWAEWTGPPATVAAYLGSVPANEDAIENSTLWLIGIEHPSWVDSAHAVVIRGNEIVFDPGGDQLLRPPLDEMTVTGHFILSPIDAGRFALVA